MLLILCYKQELSKREGIPADDCMRSRYYQSVMDINLLEKGADYGSLKKSYVIFICTFDFFGAGRHIYHFENLCREEPSIKLGDGTEKIFLNTKGIMEDVSPELKNLLGYFETQEPRDSYTRELEAAVAAARRHEEWEVEYMMRHIREMDAREEGREEGIKEGIEAGQERNLIKLLCRKILKGKSPEVIAEELEEELENIQPLYDVAIQFAPDFDIDEIYARMHSELQ